MTRRPIEAGLVVLALGAGVVFSQKIRDLIAGVPASLRAQLNAAEAAAVAELQGPTGTKV